MSVIMFQDRFAEKVRDGSKPHTIRRLRKRPIKVGERLSLRRWTGKAYRSKQEVLRDCECESVVPITIEYSENGRVGFRLGRDGWRLDAKEISTLAIDDGFDSAASMVQWFIDTHGLPFHGVIIEWKI